MDYIKNGKPSKECQWMIDLSDLLNNIISKYDKIKKIYSLAVEILEKYLKDSSDDIEDEDEY